MISQTVEYALRAIVTIAQHNGRPCTSRTISQITQVPGAYLSKLMQGLVRAGFVNSQRGRKGGFVLTKKPSELTVWDIVDSIEPIQRIHECPLKIQSHRSTLCPLHRKLDNVMETIENSLRETTVAELLSQPGHPTPLCEEQKVISLDLGAADMGRANGNS